MECASLSKAIFGSKGLEKGLLRQFLRITAGAGPPVGETEHHAMMLANPAIEGLIVYMQIRIPSSAYPVPDEPIFIPRKPKIVARASNAVSCTRKSTRYAFASFPVGGFVTGSELLLHLPCMYISDTALHFIGLSRRNHSHNTSCTDAGIESSPLALR